MEKDNTEIFGIALAKKTEKIITATYLISNLLDDEEPIRMHIRENSLVLLKSVNRLAQRHVHNASQEYRTTLTTITEMIALFHVARASKVISHMNASMLIDALRAIQLIVLDKQYSINTASFDIENEEVLYQQEESQSYEKEGLFVTSYDALLPEGRDQERVIKKTEIKDISDTTHRYGNMHQNEKDKKSQKNNAGNTVRSAQGEGTPLTPIREKKNNRRQMILDVMIRGVDVSIKDISHKVRGCSEKTIQRELNNLVLDNLIERIGEKRWSRYVKR